MLYIDTIHHLKKIGLTDGAFSLLRVTPGSDEVNYICQLKNLQPAPALRSDQTMHRLMKTIKYIVCDESVLEKLFSFWK